MACLSLIFPLFSGSSSSISIASFWFDEDFVVFVKLGNLAFDFRIELFYILLKTDSSSGTTFFVNPASINALLRSLKVLLSRIT